jgi:Transposase and inactivated derivatives
MKSIAYVGLDVHKDSIVAAIYAGDDREPVIERTLPHDYAHVRKVFTRWSEIYDLHCCYEASSCGYVLQRWLCELGIGCEIAAPSLIPVRPGDRVKTDRRDARKLSKLYRAGELTLIHIPSETEESVRGLVRCRETISREVRQSKNYVSKFLQARGFVYRDGENWTEKHWRYLLGLKLEPIDQQVLREYICLLQYKLNRLEDLDTQIEQIAFSEGYEERIGRLRCLRGVDTHSAMVLVSEIGDFSRFSSATELMSYLGLAPGCHQSGSSSQRRSITKAGNSRCRHVLVQAAWNYRHKPGVSEKLKSRQSGQSAEVISVSWKAQHRLHKRFWSLSARMPSNKAVVAVARELVGFIWAIMTGVPDIKDLRAA